jgi:sphingomyelin phosphodiesterase 2
MIGSSLLTMSRFPIVDAAFYRFRMSGKPLDIAHGDYYAGKGIGFTRINTSDGRVDVYNCHTHAQYEYQIDNEYAVYNETNLYEAARFIHANSRKCPSILCGDLNTRPEQLGYKIITKMGNLSDAYHSLHAQYPITFSVDNPYVDFPNQCLDYVLLRNAECKSIEIVMNEHFSGRAKAYSDHYGLFAEFHLTEETVTNDDFEAVLKALYQEVKLARIDAENEQMSHFEGIAIALFSIGDGLLTAAFLGRFSRSLGQLLRRLILFGSLAYVLYALFQSGLNFQARRNNLTAIEQELKRQIDAKRLFDGREFSS